MKIHLLAFCAACLLAATLTGCNSDRLTPTLVEPSGVAAIKKLGEQPAAAKGEELRSTTFQQDTLFNFMEAAYRDINDYWVEVFAEAKYKPPTAIHRFPEAGRSLMDKCGNSDDDTARYCALDDTITISQKVAADVAKDVARESSGVSAGLAGDFAVATVIAHEYAHNIQAELGILRNADGTRRYPTYRTELQADCWSGVWASSAYTRGLLDDDDIREGLETAWNIGDLNFDHEDHHGTPDQRATAFIEGFKSGKPLSCDRWLLKDPK